MGVLNLFKGMGRAERAGQAAEQAGKAGQKAQRAEQTARKAGQAEHAANEAGKAAGQGERAAEHSHALDWMEHDAKVKVNPEPGTSAPRPAAKTGESAAASRSDDPAPSNSPDTATSSKVGEPDAADEAKEAVAKKHSKARDLGGKAWKTIKAHPVGTLGGGAAMLSAINPSIGSFLTEKSADGAGNIVKGVTGGLTKAGKGQSSILQAVMTPAGMVAGAGLAGKVLGIGKGGILDTIENVALLGGGAGMAYNYYTAKTARNDPKAGKDAGRDVGAQTRESTASPSLMRTSAVPAAMDDGQPNL